MKWLASLFRRKKAVRATVIKVDRKPKPSTRDKIHMQLRRELREARRG